MKRWTWGLLALSAVGLALAFALFYPGVSETLKSSASPGPQLVLDLVQDTGWCNTINNTHNSPIGNAHQAAICLTGSGVPASDFNIVVNYSSTLNSCSSRNQTGTALDANPDFISTVGTGWNCSGGGLNYPKCGETAGEAFISCGTVEDPGTISGNWAIAVIDWTALAAGADNLTFGTAALYDYSGENILRCPGVDCIGATEMKGPTPTPIAATATFTPTPTITNTPTITPTPTITNTPTITPTPTNTTTPTNTPTATETPIPPTPTPTPTESPYCPNDVDCDGVPDVSDNCPTVYNPDQKNSDGGRRPNGPNIPNEWASNPAQDRMGDACDLDNDNDALPDSEEFDDHCPYRLVADSDSDGVLDGFEATNGYDPCNGASKPSWAGGSDGDNDGLLDGSERGGYNTCAFTGDIVPGYSLCAPPSDSDLDGCADMVEVLDLNGDRFADSGDRGLENKRIAGIIASDPVSDSIFDLNKDGFIDSGDQGLMNRSNCMRNPNQLGCPMCLPE